MEVSGRVGTFEGERLRGSIIRHILGKWRYIGLAICVVIGLILGFYLSRILRLAGDDRLALDWFVAGVVTTVVAGFAILAFMANRMRKGWRDRGAPMEVDVSYAVTTDGFVMISELSTIVARWQFISEVALSRDCWMIFGVGMAYFLPRRLFHSPVEEKAFVSALLDGLQPAARARSGVSEKFLTA